MKNLFSVKDKVVLITGGTGILGSCMVHHFAEQGAKVVFFGRNLENGKKLEEEVTANGFDVLFLQADVMDRPRLEECYDLIDRRKVGSVCEFSRLSVR